MGKGERFVLDEWANVPDEKTISQMKHLGMEEFEVAHVGPNRAQRRLRVRARFHVGRVIKPPFKPSKDPNETNHERVVRQRSLRKMLQGVK